VTKIIATDWLVAESYENLFGNQQDGLMIIIFLFSISWSSSRDFRIVVPDMILF